jgi:hypothetical protein
MVIIVMTTTNPTSPSCEEHGNSTCLVNQSVRKNTSVYCVVCSALVVNGRSKQGPAITPASSFLGEPNPTTAAPRELMVTRSELEPGKMKWSVGSRNTD